MHNPRRESTVKDGVDSSLTSGFHTAAVPSSAFHHHLHAKGGPSPSSKHTRHPGSGSGVAPTSSPRLARPQNPLGAVAGPAGATRCPGWPQWSTACCTAKSASVGCRAPPRASCAPAPRPGPAACRRRPGWGLGVGVGGGKRWMCRGWCSAFSERCLVSLTGVQTLASPPLPCLAFQRRVLVWRQYAAHWGRGGWTLQPVAQCSNTQPRNTPMYAHTTLPQPPSSPDLGSGGPRGRCTTRRITPSSPRRC